MFRRKSIWHVNVHSHVLYRGAYIYRERERDRERERLAYIRRPLLARGHQAARQGALSQRSMLFFHSLIYHVSYFKYSSNIPSAITIWWSTGQQTGVWQSRGQQAGDIDLLLDALDQQFTTQHPRVLKSGWSWKSMKFQCISNTPENHKNGLPRPPKVIQMRSQEVPKVVKITKILKKWNLMKTSIFTVLLKG